MNLRAWPAAAAALAAYAAGLRSGAGALVALGLAAFVAAALRSGHRA